MPEIKALVSGDNANPLAVGPHIFFRPPGGWRDTLVLVAGTEQDYTVPDNAKWLILSATEDFWVDPDITAVVPSGSIINGSSPELNPVGFVVKGGETLSFISAANCKVSISVYRKAAQ